MDPNYKVYIRDLQFKNNPNIERRKCPIIQQILYDTAPKPFNIQLISSTGHGYIISHGADKDLNYIFNPEFITKLHTYHLKAELINDMRIRRQIVVTDLPDDRFSKPVNILSEEINSKNNLEIISLVKYKNNNTSDNYFFITLASVESSKRTTDKRSIVLFDKQVPAVKPRIKPSNNHQRQGSTTYNYNRQGSFPNYSNQQGSSTNYHNHQGSFPNYNNQTLPLNSPADTRSNTSKGSPFNYSDQGRGKALSPKSTWGGNSSRNARPLVDTSVPPPNWKILRKQPYHRPQYQNPTKGTPNTNLPTTTGSDILHPSINTPKSDFDIKSFVEATSKISETISYGMANPEAYLSIVNEALSKQGVPTVYVSPKNLSDSRKLYNLNKSAKSPISQPSIPPQPNLVQPSLHQSQSRKPQNISPPVSIPKPLPIPQIQSIKPYQPIAYGPHQLAHDPPSKVISTLKLSTIFSTCKLTSLLPESPSSSSIHMQNTNFVVFADFPLLNIHMQNTNLVLYADEHSSPTTKKALLPILATPHTNLNNSSTTLPSPIHT